MDILDILLLPKKFYKKITGKKSTLFIGIVLDGILFILFTLIHDFSKLFSGKPLGVLYYNITLAMIFIVFMGFVDVLFFSIPLFDLFKRFKKKKEDPNQEELLTKFMKIYICGSFIILPINLVFDLVLTRVSIPSGIGIELLLSIVILLPTFWGAAAITRGINEIYEFESSFKRLVFLSVVAWSTVLSIVLYFAFHTWMLPLFK